MTLVFVVNGQEAPVEVRPELPLREAVLTALRETRNLARPLSDWEVRDERGHAMPLDKPLLGLRVYVTLRIGLGASPTCTALRGSTVMVEAVLADSLAYVPTKGFCGKPAKFRTSIGPRCEQCGERLVEAVMSDKTTLGLVAKESGTRPATKEAARAQLLRSLR